MRSGNVAHRLQGFQYLLTRRSLHIIARVVSTLSIYIAKTTVPHSSFKRRANSTIDRGETMSVEVGDLAPDFELKSHTGGTVKLSDFRGKKNVFIAFYPLDWTPV